jgi:hypothetical protein
MRPALLLDGHTVLTLMILLLWVSEFLKHGDSMLSLILEELFGVVSSICIGKGPCVDSSSKAWSSC